MKKKKGVDKRFKKLVREAIDKYRRILHINDFEGETLYIAHEMSHILTQPMINIATATYKTDSETDDAWESLTERISRLALQIAELKK